jgi:hypothetical protein
MRIATGKSWQREHWQSIRSAYGNAAYFEHYAPDFEPLFNQKFTFLWDADMAFLEKMLNIFKLPAEKIRLRSALQGQDFEYRKDHFHPKKQEETALTPYPQAFMERHGFIPGLSMLDRLFNAGTGGWLPK